MMLIQRKYLFQEQFSCSLHAFRLNIFYISNRHFAFVCYLYSFLPLLLGKSSAVWVSGCIIWFTRWFPLSETWSYFPNNPSLKFQLFFASLSGNPAHLRWRHDVGVRNEWLAWDICWLYREVVGPPAQLHSGPSEIRHSSSSVTCKLTPSFCI